VSQTLHDHCGVFGIYGSNTAARQAYYGLFALQHRGQESSGIVAADGERLRIHRDMGLVSNVFGNGDPTCGLPGSAAIGHNRYSTTGTSDLQNAQPILVISKRGQVAAAHNGNLVNAAPLRAEMEEQGSIFQTTTDSEVVVHLIARSQK
jgi:amidophosphoribosyltransferase